MMSAANDPTKTAGSQRRGLLSDYRSLPRGDRTLVKVFSATAICAYLVMGTRHAWAIWPLILTMIVVFGLFGRMGDAT